MNKIWTFIDNQNWRVITKYTLTPVIFSIIFGLAGFIAWLIIRNWAFSTLDWMICFIGYPIVFSWFYIFVYLGRHSYHSKRKI